MQIILIILPGLINKSEESLNKNKESLESLAIVEEKTNEISHRSYEELCEIVKYKLNIGDYKNTRFGNPPNNHPQCILCPNQLNCLKERNLKN